jgi:hypothetical protein
LNFIIKPNFKKLKNPKFPNFFGFQSRKKGTKFVETKINAPPPHHDLVKAKSQIKSEP